MQADVCEAPGRSCSCSGNAGWVDWGRGSSLERVEENRYDQACSTNLLHSRPRSGHWGPRLKTKSNQTALLSRCSLAQYCRGWILCQRSIPSQRGVLGDKTYGGAW